MVRSQKGDLFPNQFAAAWGASRSEDMASPEATTAHVPPASRTRTHLDVVVDGQVFNVERKLLTNHSPFFRHILQKKENKTKSKLKLSGVSATTLSILLDYMQTGDLAVTPGNVTELFNAAFRLHMAEVVKKCIQMETEAAPLGQQILMYTAARRLKLSEEERRVFSYLAANFIYVVTEKEFLEMDIEDIMPLMSAETIGCHCEPEVFEAGMRWLNHAPIRRHKYVGKVMDCVRFSSMDLTQLQQCLEYPGVNDMNQVREKIADAMSRIAKKSNMNDDQSEAKALQQRLHLSEQCDVPVVAIGELRSKSAGAVPQPVKKTSFSNATPGRSFLNRASYDFDTHQDVKESDRSGDSSKIILQDNETDGKDGFAQHASQVGGAKPLMETRGTLSSSQFLQKDCQPCSTDDGSTRKTSKGGSQLLLDETRKASIAENRTEEGGTRKGKRKSSASEEDNCVSNGEESRKRARTHETRTHSIPAALFPEEYRGTVPEDSDLSKYCTLRKDSIWANTSEPRTSMCYVESVGAPAVADRPSAVLGELSGMSEQSSVIELCKVPSMFSVSTYSLVQEQEDNPQTTSRKSTSSSGFRNKEDVSRSHSGVASPGPERSFSLPFSVESTNSTDKSAGSHNRSSAENQPASLGSSEKYRSGVQSPSAEEITTDDVTFTAAGEVIRSTPAASGAVVNTLREESPFAKAEPMDPKAMPETKRASEVAVAADAPSERELPKHADEWHPYRTHAGSSFPERSSTTPVIQRITSLQRILAAKELNPRSMHHVRLPAAGGIHLGIAVHFVLVTEKDKKLATGEQEHEHDTTPGVLNARAEAPAEDQPAAQDPEVISNGEAPAGPLRGTAVVAIKERDSGSGEVSVTGDTVQPTALVALEPPQGEDTAIKEGHTTEHEHARDSLPSGEKPDGAHEQEETEAAAARNESYLPYLEVESPVTDSEGGSRGEETSPVPAVPQLGEISENALVPYDEENVGKTGSDEAGIHDRAESDAADSKVQKSLQGEQTVPGSTSEDQLVVRTADLHEHTESIQPESDTKPHTEDKGSAGTGLKSAENVIASSEASHHDETIPEKPTPGEPARSQPPPVPTEDVMVRKDVLGAVPKEHTADVFLYVSMVSHAPAMIVAPVPRSEVPVAALQEGTDQRDPDNRKQVLQGAHEMSARDQDQASDPGEPLTHKATTEGLVHMNAEAVDVRPEAHMLQETVLSDEIAPAVNDTSTLPALAGIHAGDAEDKANTEVATPESYLPYLEVESPVSESEAVSPRGEEKLHDVHENKESPEGATQEPPSQIPYLEVESPVSDSEIVSPRGEEKLHDVHENKESPEGATQEPLSQIPYLEVESPVSDSEAVSPSDAEKLPDEAREDKEGPEETTSEPESYLPYLEVEPPVSDSEDVSPSPREKSPAEVESPAATYDHEDGTEAIGKEAASANLISKNESADLAFHEQTWQGVSGEVLQEKPESELREADSKRHMKEEFSPTEAHIEEDVPKQESTALPKDGTVSAISVSTHTKAGGTETSPVMQKATSLTTTSIKTEGEKPHDEDAGKPSGGHDEHYVLQKTQISAIAPMHSVHLVEENVSPGTLEDHPRKLTKVQKRAPRVRAPIPEAETGGSSADESSDADVPSIEDRQARRKRTRSNQKTLSRSPVFLRTRIVVKGPNQSVELVSEKSPASPKDATPTGASTQAAPTAGGTAVITHDDSGGGTQEHGLWKEEEAPDGKISAKDSVNIERVMKKLSEVTQQKKLMEDAYSKEGAESQLEGMQQDIQRLKEHEESLKEVLKALAQPDDLPRTTEVKEESTPSKLSATSPKSQNVSLASTQENTRVKKPTVCKNEAVKDKEVNASASGLHASEKANVTNSNAATVHETRTERTGPAENETKIVKNLSANSMGSGIPPGTPHEDPATSRSEMLSRPPLKVVRKRIQLETVRTTVTEQQQNVKTVTDQKTGVEQKTSHSETTTKGEVQNRVTEETVETYDTPEIMSDTLLTQPVPTVSTGVSPETPGSPEKSPDVAGSPPSPPESQAQSSRKRKGPVAIRVTDEYDSDEGDKEAVDTLPLNSAEPRSILKPPRRTDEPESEAEQAEEHSPSEGPSWEAQIEQEERIRRYQSPDEFFANFVSKGRSSRESEDGQDNGSLDGSQEQHKESGAAQQQPSAAVHPSTENDPQRADNERMEKPEQPDIQKMKVTREAEVVQLAILAESYEGKKDPGSRSVQAIAEGSFDTYTNKPVKSEVSHLPNSETRAEILPEEQPSTEQGVLRRRASDRVRSFQTLSELSITGHLVVHKRKPPSKTEAITVAEEASHLKETITAVSTGTSLSVSNGQLVSTEGEAEQKHPSEVVPQPDVSAEHHQPSVDGSQALRDGKTSVDPVSETVECTCVPPRASRRENADAKHSESYSGDQPWSETHLAKTAQDSPCACPQTGQDFESTEASEEESSGENGPSLLEVISSVYMEAISTVKTLPFFEAKRRDNVGLAANAPVPVLSEPTAQFNSSLYSKTEEARKEKHGAASVRAEKKEDVRQAGAPPGDSPLVLQRAMISEVECIGEILSLTTSEYDLWNDGAKDTEDSDTRTFRTLDFPRQSVPGTGDELGKAAEESSEAFDSATHGTHTQEEWCSAVAPSREGSRKDSPTNTTQDAHHDSSATESNEDADNAGKTLLQERTQISEDQCDASNSSDMYGAHELSAACRKSGSDLSTKIAERCEEDSRCSQALDTARIMTSDSFEHSDTQDGTGKPIIKRYFASGVGTEREYTHVDDEAAPAASQEAEECIADEQRAEDAGTHSAARMSSRAVSKKKGKIDKVSLADVFKVPTETIAQQSKNPQWVFFETEVVTGTEQAADGGAPSDSRRQNRQMGEQGAPAGVDKLTGPSTSRRPVEVVARGGVVPWAKKKASLERSKQKVVAQPEDIVSASEPPPRGRGRPQGSLALETVTSEAGKAKTSKDEVAEITAEIPQRAGSEPMFKTLKGDSGIGNSSVLSPMGTTGKLGSTGTSVTKPLPTDAVRLVTNLPPAVDSAGSSSSGTTSKELIIASSAGTGSQVAAKAPGRSSTSSVSHFCETVKRLPDSSRSTTPTELNAETGKVGCQEHETTKVERLCSKPESVRNIIRRIRKKNQSQVAKGAAEDKWQEEAKIASTVGNSKIENHTPEQDPTQRVGSESTTATAAQAKRPSAVLPGDRTAAGAREVQDKGIVQGPPNREKIMHSPDVKLRTADSGASPRRNMVSEIEKGGEHPKAAGGIYKADTLPQSNDDVKQGTKEPDPAGSEQADAEQAAKAEDSKQIAPDEGITKEELERYTKIVKELKYRRGSSVPPSGTLQSNENVPGPQKKPVVVMDAKVQLFGKGRISLSFDATAENGTRDDSQTMVRRFSSSLQTPKGSSTELKQGFIPPPPTRQPSMDASKRKSVDFGLLSSAYGMQPDTQVPRNWPEDTSTKRRYSDQDGQSSNDPTKQRACKVPRALSSTSEGRTGLLKDNRLQTSPRTKKPLKAAVDEVPHPPTKPECKPHQSASSTKNADVGSRSTSRKSTKNTDVKSISLCVSTGSERPASAPPSVNREHRRRPSPGPSAKSPTRDETSKPLADDTGYRTCDSRLGPVAEKSPELSSRDDVSRVIPPQPVPAPRAKPTAPPDGLVPSTVPHFHDESGTDNVDTRSATERAGRPKSSQLPPSAPQKPSAFDPNLHTHEFDAASGTYRAKVSLPVKQTKTENVHETKTGRSSNVAPTRFRLIVDDKEPPQENSKQSVPSKNGLVAGAKSRDSKRGAPNVQRVTQNGRTNVEEIVAFQVDLPRKRTQAPGTEGKASVHSQSRKSFAEQPLSALGTFTSAVTRKDIKPAEEISRKMQQAAPLVAALGVEGLTQDHRPMDESEAAPHKGAPSTGQASSQSSSLCHAPLAKNAQRRRGSNKCTTKSVEWLELQSTYDSPCIVTIVETFDQLSETYASAVSHSQNSQEAKSHPLKGTEHSKDGSPSLQSEPVASKPVEEQSASKLQGFGAEQTAKGQNELEQVARSKEFLCSEPTFFGLDAQMAHLEAATLGQVTSQQVELAKRSALLAVPIEELLRKKDPKKNAVTKKRTQALQEELLIARLLVKQTSSHEVSSKPQITTKPKGELAGKAQPSSTAEEAAVGPEKAASLHLTASKTEEKKALPRGCFSKGSLTYTARAAKSISLEVQEEATGSVSVADESALQSGATEPAKGKDGHLTKHYLPIKKTQSETETRWPGAKRIQKKTGQRQAVLGDVIAYPVEDGQKTVAATEGCEDIVPRDSLPPVPADGSKQAVPGDHPSVPSSVTSDQLPKEAKDGALVEPVDMAAKEKALEKAGSAHTALHQRDNNETPAAAQDHQLLPELTHKDSVKERKGNDAGRVVEYRAGELTAVEVGQLKAATPGSKSCLSERTGGEKDEESLIPVKESALGETKMLPVEATGLSDRRTEEIVEKVDDHAKTVPSSGAEQPLAEHAAQEVACAQQEKEPPTKQGVKTLQEAPALTNIPDVDDTAVASDHQMTAFKSHDVVLAPQEQLAELHTELAEPEDVASPQTSASLSRDYDGDLLHVGGIFVTSPTSGESPHRKPSTRTTDAQTEFSAPPSVSSTELFSQRCVREVSTSAVPPKDAEVRKAPDELPPYLERVTLSAKPSIADMIRKLSPHTEEWDDNVPTDWRLDPARDIEKWSSPCVQDARSPTLLLLGGIKISALGEVLTGCLVLRYNLAENVWRRCSMMPLPRYGHRCVYTNGEVYVIGGFDNRDATYGLRMSTNFCFRYNIQTGEWSVTAPLQHARGYHGVAALNNYIYTVGGVDTSDLLLSSVERYDREQDSWTVLEKGLYCGRMGMGVAAFRNNLWVVGGVVQIAGLQTCSTAYVEIYNPATNQWTYAANHLPSPRTCVSLLAVDDSALYCFGGIFYNCVGTDRKLVTIDDILVYAADDKGWKQMSSMPTPRHNAHVLQCGGQRLVVGGQDIDKSDQPVTSILAMEISGTNIDWKPLKDVPLPISAYGAVIIPPMGESSAQAPSKQPVRSDN